MMKWNYQRDKPPVCLAERKTEKLEFGKAGEQNLIRISILNFIVQSIQNRRSVGLHDMEKILIFIVNQEIISQHVMGME